MPARAFAAIAKKSGPFPKPSYAGRTRQSPSECSSINWPKALCKGSNSAARKPTTPNFCFTPRTVNALIDRISNTIRLSKKMPDEMVRIDLPPAVGNLLIFGKPSEANRLYLGKKPDRVRLDAKSAAAFLQRVRPNGVIVEGLNSNTLHQMRAICENVSLIVALPQVFFEDQIPADQKAASPVRRRRPDRGSQQLGRLAIGKSGQGDDGSRAGLAGAQFAGSPSSWPKKA